MCFTESAKVHADCFRRREFEAIDGPTSGPRGFKGSVGAALNFEPCDLPIIGFKAVPGDTKDVADDIKADLSDDQELSTTGLSCSPTRQRFCKSRKHCVSFNCVTGRSQSCTVVNM